MPGWATIALVVGVVLLLAAAVGGAFLGWRAYSRKRLLRLLVKAEAVEAAAQGLDETLTRLSEGDDEALAEFAKDPESSERRALHEVAMRATMLADELDRMALPRSLVVLAEELGDAAFLVAQEASRISDDDREEGALELLATIDLKAVRAYTQKARRSLAEVSESFGLDETAVYGGGLYL
ncbi:MAG: hypothetical protein U1E26_07245 [Coriobacteriia bacterium]|nr:hypothetical protein [Coriobacteriia bacterium]